MKLTSKVDIYRTPLQNCFKTYKYCDNTCKYCTCRWTHFFKYWLNTSKYYHNTYKYCHDTCEYWAGEYTLKETFRHKTHFTVLLHFEVRSHYNKIENQEGERAECEGCVLSFFLGTFSFVSVLILFYFCNCLLSWNEYMNTNEVSLTWYATFYVLFLTYLTLKVLRIRKVGSCRCHQISSFLPKNFLNKFEALF